MRIEFTGGDMGRKVEHAHSLTGNPRHPTSVVCQSNRSTQFIISDGLPKLLFGLEKYGGLNHAYLALISPKTSWAGRPVAVPSRTD